MTSPRREGPPRLLFVHAHPDDETLATGVALAHHVSAGHEVHVLTCTLGEQGEVIPPELAHLAADQDDTLGAYRRDELRGAMAALGAHHRVLGEDGAGPTYRDSGMAGTASAADPRAFAQADLAAAADQVAGVVVEVDPDVVVTYDAQGGYAHPDHIKTHQVTCAAVAGLGERGHRQPPLLAVVTPRSWAEEDRAWLREHGPGRADWALPDGPFPPSVVDDAVVTHAVVDPGAVPAQVAALRHHRTQVTVDPPRYALSNDIAALLPGREGYVEIDPATGQPLLGANHTGGPRRGLLEAGR